MRIRATVAAVSGALALSAFAVPAAHAAGSSVSDVTFSDVKLNNGKNIVVGATAEVVATATYTVTHPADLSASTFDTGPVLYRGAELTLQGAVGGDDPGTCTAASSTVLHCTAKIQFRPAASDSDEDLSNAQAGSWKVGAVALDHSGHFKLQGDLGSTKVQRLSKLTVNASPEPVAKGRTITVTGTLTRANWDTHKYAGYGTQPVVLQFRKAGTTNYTNVKGIKSTSTGTLKTTTTATVDGYYRFSFAGTTTTPAVSATGDFVDVQ